jgi:cysteine-rich repeat protein
MSPVCVLPEQVAACADRAEGAACEVAGASGLCAGGVCWPSGCGTGTVEGDEVCDDGNTASGDGCASDCRSDETCGNGIRDVGEACDDGNPDDADGCRADCTQPRCGDGVLDATEACDDGAANADAPDACRTTCVAPRCGDAILDAGEVCDDGNLAADDGCRPDCASDETCGNGALDVLSGEVCDDGAALAADGCSSTCQAETLAWREVAGQRPLGRQGAALAYDPVRREVVMVGGFVNGYADRGLLWAWDGGAWAPRFAARTPGAREDAALAFDTARGRLVLFGGFGGACLSDTWEWDGAAWSKLTPETAPPPRRSHAMAYDPIAGVVVLFGGYDDDYVDLGDAWAWDGSTWDELELAGGPGAPWQSALVFEPRLGRVVLLASSPAAAPSLWRLEADAWVEVAAAGLPTATYATLAFDVVGQRLVAMGSAGTYALVGATWSQLASAAATPDRSQQVGAYDVARGQLVVYGGTSQNADTWVWDAGGWSQRPAALPGQRAGMGLVEDLGRGQLVMFGGAAGGGPLAETWEWSGSSWRRHTPAVSPPATSVVAMTYDRARARTVAVIAGQTWLWDGATWSLAPAATPVIDQGALAYDAGREVSVLFGDEPAATWEWDGVAWTERTPAVSPSGRAAHGMAYDDARAKVVLFGGVDLISGDTLDDTWEWDGSAWLERAAVQRPLGRQLHGMTYDPRRGAVVVYAGWSGGGNLGDLWAWDGDTWAELDPRNALTSRQGVGLAFDRIQQRVVSFGGEDGDGPLAATTELAYQGGGAIEACGSGHDADLDGLVGCDDPDCWGVCTPACPPDLACDPDAPACGDGVCGGVESCRLCPGDCGDCPAACGDGFCDAGEDAAGCPGDCLAP